MALKSSGSPLGLFEVLGEDVLAESAGGLLQCVR